MSIKILRKVARQNEIATLTLNEILAALNEHDDLVRERDNLLEEVADLKWDNEQWQQAAAKEFGGPGWTTQR